MAAKPEDAVALVRGKKIELMQGSALRREATQYERVVVDLGAGDGRFAYRLARRHPRWFLLAVDANAAGLAEVSYRAGRKPSRGGIASVRFIRASVEHLPPALIGLADEVAVLYPWGSLLRAVIEPRLAVLSAIAGLGRQGARVHIVINTSALTEINGDVTARLAPVYAEAGILLTRVERCADASPTSWGLRVGQGRPAEALMIEGVVRSAGFGASR